MPRRIRLSVLALAAVVAGCDHSAPTGSEETPSAPSAISQAPGRSAERAAMDRLARRLAAALADPAFRSSLKTQLDRSPFVEHKLQLQSFLRASNHKALKDVARLNGTTESNLDAEAAAAIPLEIYFPVPAHRAA